MTIEGAPWLHGPSKTIGLDAATAHILCEHHNSLLGASADVTGRDLRTLVSDSVRAKPTDAYRYNLWIERPSGIVMPRPETTISGRAYGAWLCKTHCNITALAGKTPDPAYVQYAFGRPTDTRLYFYYPHVKGEDVTFTALPHVTYVDFKEPGEPFAVQVCGLWALVALRPMLQDAFLDRVAEIRFRTLLLRFDWSTDPPLDCTQPAP